MRSHTTMPRTGHVGVVAESSGRCAMRFVDVPVVERCERFDDVTSADYSPGELARRASRQGSPFPLRANESIVYRER
jgi:hypothetical protein